MGQESRLVKLPLTLTIIRFLFDNEMYVKGQLSILIPIIEKAIVNRKNFFVKKVTARPNSQHPFKIQTAFQKNSHFYY